MVNSCVVKDCTNRAKAGSGITVHAIPTKGPRRVQWLNNIARKDFNPAPSSYARVCSVHFVSGMTNFEFSDA